MQCGKPNEGILFPFKDDLFISMVKVMKTKREIKGYDTNLQIKISVFDGGP